MMPFCNHAFKPSACIKLKIILATQITGVQIIEGPLYIVIYLALVDNTFSIMAVLDQLFIEYWFSFISSSSSTLGNCQYAVGSVTFTSDNLFLKGRVCINSECFLKWLYEMAIWYLLDFYLVYSMCCVCLADRQNLQVMGVVYFLYLLLFSGLEYSLTFLCHQVFNYTR